MRATPSKPNAKAKVTTGDRATDEQFIELLADKVQEEWGFWLRRLPETIITRAGVVVVILALLEVLLVVSNNYYYLGWEWFVQWSTQGRDVVIRSRAGTAMQLGSSWLATYSLWRGWVVPSLLAAVVYVGVALLSLRVELYHWKPELLQHYIVACRQSYIGRRLPTRWLDWAFLLYEDEHRKAARNRIQRRQHIALQDSRQFLKVVRVVARNIAVSAAVLLVYWLFLLQAGIDADAGALRLPRSYVPPVQCLVWYLCDDFFYYYLHWMAHHHPASSRHILYRIAPTWITLPLHQHLRTSHRLHHRTKANLGIAAWYCSVWEQLLLNLLPAIMGPYLTQRLARSLHVEHVWGTHLVTLYVWLMAGSAMSVLGHTGYRSRFNDPGKHDLHHERAFDQENSVNFGTLGLFDWLHGTASSIPKEDARVWREQRTRQAALLEASRRTGIPLSQHQRDVVQQPQHDGGWEEKRSI